MGSDLGIKPEDLSKMALEDISNDMIGYNCSLSLQSLLSSSLFIVTKEMDIFNKKDKSRMHVKILTRISSSLKSLKYMSRDYAYSIAYNNDNDDNNDNESNNNTNNDDDKRIENDKKVTRNIWKQLIKLPLMKKD